MYSVVARNLTRGEKRKAMKIKTNVKAGGINRVVVTDGKIPA